MSKADARVLVLLGTLSLLTATARPDTVPTATASSVAGSTQSQPVQKIGRDDLLSISVYEMPEMTRTVRVDGSGLIHLPVLETSIHAEGLYPSELETVLASELKKEELMVDPIVSVTIAEYHSRPVSVNGAVRKPLVFQAFGVTTLLDALAKAEGVLPEAGADVIVTSGSGDQQLVRRINLDALLSKSDPSLNLTLTGGESIRVPESGKVYVVGNVKRPGEFRMPRVGDTTVLKVLALSEGLAPYSTKTAYIYRREAGGKKNEIPIDLKEIIKRQAPDVTLQANDVLYIPDDSKRRLTMSTIDRIVTFGAATGSGVLIWR